MSLGKRRETQVTQTKKKKKTEQEWERGGVCRGMDKQTDHMWYWQATGFQTSQRASSSAVQTKWHSQWAVQTISPRGPNSYIRCRRERGCTVGANRRGQRGKSRRQQQIIPRKHEDRKRGVLKGWDGNGEEDEEKEEEEEKIQENRGTNTVLLPSNNPEMSHHEWAARSPGKY